MLELLRGKVKVSQSRGLCVCQCEFNKVTAKRGAFDLRKERPRPCSRTARTELCAQSLAQCQVGLGLGLGLEKKTVHLVLQVGRELLREGKQRREHLRYG